MTLIHHDPEEAALEVARQIKWRRRRKVVLQVAAAGIVVVLVLGIAIGIWIVRLISASADVHRQPDQRYASINCHSSAESIWVPSNGFEFPTRCFLTIIVRSGVVQAVPPAWAHRATVQIAPNFHLDDQIIERVYPVEGWAVIDFHTSPR